MDRKKVLFYFTESFPFNGGESFINSEFPWLAKSFDKIVIITNGKGQLQVEMSKDVEVITTAQIMQGKQRFSSMLGNLLTITSILLSEYKHCNARSYFLKNWRYYNSQLINALIRAKYLKQHKDFHRSAAFYSFWMNDHALTLALMRKKDLIDRFVFRVHGFDLIKERWPNSFIPFQYTCHKYVDKIFTVSKKSLEYFKNVYVHKNKASYSYLGSNDQGLNPEPKSGEITLVSCSNIIPLKRLHLIVEILSKVHVKLNWEHFGSGELKEDIEALARTLPKNIKVTFHGQVDQSTLFEFYRTRPINYFINVSNTEGLPFSIIEAVSFGIPIIATDVGGTSEITNEHTGLLIPENFNVSDVASVLNRNEELQYSKKEFRQGVRKFWEKHFASTETYPQFIKNFS